MARTPEEQAAYDAAQAAFSADLLGGTHRNGPYGNAADELTQPQTSFGMGPSTPTSTIPGMAPDPSPSLHYIPGESLPVNVPTPDYQGGGTQEQLDRDNPAQLKAMVDLISGKNASNAASPWGMAETASRGVNMQRTPSNITPQQAAGWLSPSEQQLIGMGPQSSPSPAPAAAPMQMPVMPTIASAPAPAMNIGQMDPMASGLGGLSNLLGGAGGNVGTDSTSNTQGLSGIAQLLQQLGLPPFIAQALQQRIGSQGGA